MWGRGEKDSKEAQLTIEETEHQKSEVFGNKICI